MKSNGRGVVLVLLVAGMVAAAGYWFWSAGEQLQPADPGAVATNDSAAPGVAPGAPARADVNRDAGSLAQRTAVSAAKEANNAAGAGEEESPAATGPRVRGRVVDARGDGIAGARVAAADRDLEQLPFGIGGLDDFMAASGGGELTDADGAFDLRLEADGPFRLLATHPEHPRGEHRGEYRSGSGGEAAGGIEGVIIRLRDGARIAGRVIGVPAGVGSLFVLSRRLESSVESAAVGMLIDLGGLVDEMGAHTGRQAQVAEDRTFELRGLDPDERYAVWAAAAGESDHMPKKCTYALDLRAGTLAAELIWREPLTVSVRVVAAETNTPIEELDVAAGFVKEVKMLGMTMPIPTTKPLRQEKFPDGVVRIDHLEVRDEGEPVLAIEVRAPGRQPWIRHDVAVPRAGHVDLGIAALAEAAVVVARVIDAKSGEPIAGAQVELFEIADATAEAGDSREGQRSISMSTNVETSHQEAVSDAMRIGGVTPPMGGITDERGECRITAEFEGRAELRVRHDDFALAASEPFELASRGESTVDVTMYRGGTVQVTATDGHGAPAAGAFVQRKGPVDGDEDKERTDENGTLTLTALSIGEHVFKLLDVDAKADGPVKIGLTGILDQSAGEPVVVRDGEISRVTLAQPLRGNVQGYVTVDGAPIDNASVRLFGAAASQEEAVSEMVGSMLSGLVELGESATTDVDGVFEMERVAVGQYRVVVKHPDLVMASSTEVAIVEGDNRVEIAILATTVRGRVVDASGAPVARATVSALPAEGELADLADQMGDAKDMIAEIFGGSGGTAGVRTASDGTFELRGVRAGVPLAVQAKARLHVANEQRIDAIVAGSTREGVEVVLQQAGRIRVSAVGVRGALSAKLQWAGATSATVPKEREALLRRSRTTIDGLTPGRWTVSLDGTGLPAGLQSRTVEVAAGATERVDFGK